MPETSIRLYVNYVSIKNKPHPANKTKQNKNQTNNNKNRPENLCPPSRKTRENALSGLKPSSQEKDQRRKENFIWFYW